MQREIRSWNDAHPEHLVIAVHHGDLRDGISIRIGHDTGAVRVERVSIGLGHCADDAVRAGCRLFEDVSKTVECRKTDRGVERTRRQLSVALWSVGTVTSGDRAGSRRTNRRPQIGQVRNKCSTGVELFTRPTSVRFAHI